MGFVRISILLRVGWVAFFETKLTRPSALLVSSSCATAAAAAAAAAYDDEDAAVAAVANIDIDLLIAWFGRC